MNAVHRAVRRLLRIDQDELDRSRALRRNLDAVTITLQREIDKIDRTLATPPKERYLIEETIFPRRPKP